MPDYKNLRLDEEIRTDFEQELQISFNNSWMASSGFRDDVQAYRDIFFGRLPEKPKAWMSNIDMRLCKYMVSNSAVKLTNAVFGTDPLVEVQADNPQFDDAAADEQNYIHLWHERIRTRSKGYMAVLYALIDGNSWLCQSAKTTGKPVVAAGVEPITIADLDVIPS